MIDPTTSRRRFLHYLAASPLFGSGAALAQSPQSRLPDPMIWAPRELSALIDSPSRALSVFDFEPVARQKLSAAHFGYMATGNDDEVTLRSNREGFAAFQLRPRRLVDVSRIDMKMELFGTTYDSPIVVAPTGSNKAFHADGEIAVAKAARTGRHLQMLSTVATTSIEAAIEARGAPVWFQLYPTNEWSLGLAMAKRAEKAGAPAIVVTVDVVAAQNWEMFQRMWRADGAGGQCGSCHGLGLRSFVQRKPSFDGLDLGTATSTGANNLTWDFVKRLRDSVGTKILLKGILAREDAKLAVEHGVDGIIVSNHGGRAEDNGRSTIEVLPEILVAVDGRIPVLVDSGFRRGTDIVKALAMGAKAACIGRPYLWGLGAFGQEGVERVLQLLRRELFAAMQQMGAPSLKDLVPAMVTRA
ncbi:MAG: alpha-hydroxy-acid oxidizing protein [Alphaproteobacteria bacterium]|nr:alpha-hydroxy-acid oxidizing protein [Alphaproteobacteria bacterium]